MSLVSGIVSFRVRVRVRVMFYASQPAVWRSLHQIKPLTSVLVRINMAPIHQSRVKVVLCPKQSLNGYSFFSSVDFP